MQNHTTGKLDASKQGNGKNDRPGLNESPFSGNKGNEQLNERRESLEIKETNNAANNRKVGRAAEHCHKEHRTTRRTHNHRNVPLLSQKTKIDL